MALRAEMSLVRAAIVPPKETDMKTLNDLNSAQLLANRTREWSGWTLKSEFRLGKAGGQNARRGMAGAKLHLLNVEIVLAVDDPKYAGRVGQLHSVRGCTTGNGQMTGTVIEGLSDLSDVTCTRCRERLGRLMAIHAPQAVR